MTYTKAAYLLLPILLLILPGCDLRIYYPETNPPPETRKGIHKEVPENIHKVRAKKIARQELCDSDGCITVILVSPDGYERKPVSHCDEYWQYRKQGWSTPADYSNDDYNNDYAFIESCNVLKFVQDARPSRYSRFMMPLVEGYSLQKTDPAMLAFLPFAPGESQDNIWSPFNCGLRQCSADWGAATLKNGGLIVTHGNRHTSYFPAGRGDMNGDGWEDLLVNYYSYRFATAAEGPDRISGHFCLSWPGEIRAAAAFDCTKDNFLPRLKRAQ